jgi:hypothetical protein
MKRIVEMNLESIHELKIFTLGWINSNIAKCGQEASQSVFLNARRQGGKEAESKGQKEGGKEKVN